MMESGTSAGDDDGSRMGRRQRRRLVMHLVRRSSFLGVAAEDAGSGVIMDPQVWSKLADEIMWGVLPLLPVAKHFELQSVSRRWRQVLTSAHFRNRVIAAAAAAAAAAPREREEQQQRPVAFVWHAGKDSTSSSSSSSDNSTESRMVGGNKLKREAPVVDSSNTGATATHKLKAVDVDLRGLVPDWFLEPESYTVVSAGDGLVCVRSNSDYHHFVKLVEPQRVWEAVDREWEPTKPWVGRYCVLNPLTRTCVVLPPLPFQADMWYPPVVTGTDAGGAATVAISLWCSGTKELPTYHSDSGAAGWVAPCPALPCPALIKE